MANVFKIKWPNLNKEVRCKKIEHNQHIFHWWVEQLPIKSLQGHTMAAGEALLLVSVPLNVPVNWEIRSETMEEIRLQKEGRLTIFMGNGTSTGIVIKYGKVTEDMKYPTFAEVIEDDLHILKEVGEKQWDSMLFTKEIILAEFSTMED
jgi:hypothetical protein